MSAFSAIQKNEEIFYLKNSSDEEDINSSGDEDSATNDIDISDPRGTTITTTTTTTTTQVQNMDRAGSYYKEPIFSKFPLSSQNTVFYDDGVYFGLEANETLIFKGQFLLNILKGGVVIDDIQYDAKQSRALPVFAPVSHSLPELIAVPGSNNSNNVNSAELSTEVKNLLQQNFCTVVKVLNSRTGLETAGDICPLFKNLFHNNNYNQFSKEKFPITDSLISQDTFSPRPSDQDLNFTRYTFYLILKPTIDLSVMRVPPNFRFVIGSLTGTNSDSHLTSISATKKKIVVIGYKNSGKSTLVKVLANQYLRTSNFVDPVGILDLDPGQPEFSYPSSLSYSNHTQPLIGNNLASQQDIYNSFSNEYFGFNNPMENADFYLKLCLKLYKTYQKGDYFRQVPLIVNMPGWVKGYGIELIYRVLKIIKPTDLVYLVPPSSGNNINGEADDTDDELMERISYSSKSFFKNMNVVKIGGISLSFSSLRYSSQDLSTFKVLSYFHRQLGNRAEGKNPAESKTLAKKMSFDFTPLLYKAPLRISYLSMSDLHKESKGFISQVDKFEGVSAVSIINDNELTSIPGALGTETIATIFDCSIVGIYGIESAELINVAQLSITNFGESSDCPLIIPFKQIQDVDEDKLVFLGLGAVHSVNAKEGCFNIYVNDIDLQRIKKNQPRKSQENPIGASDYSDVDYDNDGEEEDTTGVTYKLLFIRGQTALPIWEIYPSEPNANSTAASSRASTPAITSNDDSNLNGRDQDQEQGQGQVSSKKKRLFKNEKIPFVSLNDKFGKGGKILKVRRNIMRRR